MNAQPFLTALFESLPHGVYTIDPEYRLLAVNPYRRQHAGHLTGDLAGQICYVTLFGRHEPCPECRVAETLSQACSTQRSERRWKAGDEPSEWDIQTFPVLSPDGSPSGALLLEQDVTDHTRLEGILIQSEKLAAIGQLAAGIAHEINNPLTAIIANAQILARSLPAGDDMQESVELIARAGARATQTLRNLLDFARKGQHQLTLTDINDTLRRSLALVQHELMTRMVEVDFLPEENLPLILANQENLQSVWLNLIMNAIDSLDKIPARLRVITRRGQGHLLVIVEDNGKGIPRDHLSRIFEPFYTTKAPGQGTGLGLSVCQRIVTQHGGRIWAESQPGQGSVFTVELPFQPLTAQSGIR